MFQVVNKTTSPPGMWRYKCPETGVTIGPHPAYNDLLNAVKAHYKANNLPIGLQFEQQIEDELCKHLPPDYCTKDGKVQPPNPRWSSLNFASVMQGTRTIVDWFIGYGGKRVDKTEADRRAGICSKCPHNQQPEGCSSCNMGAMRAIAEKITSGGATAYDNQLQSCNICYCQLKGKVWLPLEVLQKHMTEEQLNRTPAHCWLK